MRNFFTPTRMALTTTNIRTQIYTECNNCWQNVEKLESSYMCNRNVKWSNYCRKQFSSPHKVERRITI